MNAHARARTRRFAMQALYQWDLSGSDLPLIRRQFFETEDFTKADKPYFTELLTDIPAQLDVVDKNISDYIDRPINQLDPVERAILRIAMYELLSRIDIPFRVVINEAVKLTKKFGAEQAHTYVNGVCDKAAQKLRAIEYKKTGKHAAGH